MESVFCGLQWDILLVYMYVDDITIMGSNFEQLEWQMEVLETAENYTFKMWAF